MIRGLVISVKRVISGDMTLKQALIFAKMRVFNSQRALNDDFDWTQYHGHYREELKVVGRTATLLPDAADFSFADGRLIQANPAIKPLHPNHHLLYEILLGLDPASILEIGCGGGDHLRNMHLFRPDMELMGVDRSEEQLKTLRERHPTLPARLEIHDITDPATQLPVADVVYSQTVLMHISETQGRLAMAMRHMLESARQQIVLVEDWTEHHFLDHMRAVLAQSPAWAGASLYFARCDSRPAVRALIVSKIALTYEPLADYESLLQGRPLQIH